MPPQIFFFIEGRSCASIPEGETREWRDYYGVMKGPEMDTTSALQTSLIADMRKQRRLKIAISSELGHGNVVLLSIAPLKHVIKRGSSASPRRCPFVYHFLMLSLESIPVTNCSNSLDHLRVWGTPHHVVPLSPFANTCSKWFGLMVDATWVE